MTTHEHIRNFLEMLDYHFEQLESGEWKLIEVHGNWKCTGQEWTVSTQGMQHYLIYMLGHRWFEVWPALIASGQASKIFPHQMQHIQDAIGLYNELYFGTKESPESIDLDDLPF